MTLKNKILKMGQMLMKVSSMTQRKHFQNSLLAVGPQ